MNKSEPELSAESQETSAPESLPRPIRWGGAKWIIGIFVGLFLLVRIGSKLADNETFVGTAFTACVLFGGMALAIWWLLFSRAPWKLRLGVIVGVAALASMFRIQGFSGGFVPTIVFRWKQAVEPERPAGAVANLNLDMGQALMATELDWPEFRGPKRDGIVRGTTYSAAWLEPDLLWRIPIGEGWSSFCVLGPLAYTQWQEGESEVTVCLQAASGTELWRHVDAARFDEAMGGPGPRATPTYADGRLFVQGATGILSCLDPKTGAVLWSVNILDDAKAGNIQWAMSGSPLVTGDRVIVSPGGTDNASLIAYDVATGEQVWKAGKAIASYSSPQISSLGGTEQILIFNGIGIHGHDPDNGELLWNHDFTTGPKICVAQPGVVDGSSVLLSLGYGVGSLMVDVAEKEGAWIATERWKSRRLKSKFNDFVIRDGHAYGLDEGILTCIKLDSGERAWKGIRCGYGQLILIQDTLLILSESGEVIFAKADPEEAQELGRFKAIDGKTWNHPVIANGLLFVRNASAAACFKLAEISAPSEGE
ncbi:MAG: outer membrane protein assembly factor BamB [Rhodothermales bacterium]|jgi:outer membrane protein assembly factor BamB